jgi:hypothetical protein
VAEVGAEQRVSMGRSNCSKRLWSERGGIEELRQPLVTQTSIPDLVRAILASTVERGGAIVVAVLLAIALDGVIVAASGFGDRKRLAALPGCDRIYLPSGKCKLLEAREALSVLQRVVK